MRREDAVVEAGRVGGERGRRVGARGRVLMAAPRCGWRTTGRDEVVGDRHRCQGVDVGAAGVADRVAAGQRPGTGDDQAQQLADDLAAVVAADPGAEHGDVGAHVQHRLGLAEDVGPLQVPPLGGQVATGACGAGGGPFDRPCHCSASSPAQLVGGWSSRHPRRRRPVRDQSNPASSIAAANSTTATGRTLVTVSVPPARSIPTAWTPAIANAASATARDVVRTAGGQAGDGEGV